MKMLKKDVLSLLVRKRQGKITSSFKQLALESGYSKGHLKKLYKQLDKCSIQELSTHKNTGNPSHNAACSLEIDYIVKFKELYPVISVAQFKDIYEEDIVLNPEYKEDVKKYHLQVRSYSFYLNLFHKMNWKSPIKHKTKKDKGRLHLHPLRKPSERKGHLIQIDGTPHDWFNDGRMYCLHLAVDDATSEVLAGWFTPHECLYGYCQMMLIVLKKYGIPTYVYSDRHSILKGYAGGDTLFSLMLKRIGIDQIFANTAEAKGRIERYNGTIQRRIINDIIRFRNKGVKLDDYDDLNNWFNDYYCDYINSKFSFKPFDSNDEFEQIVDKDFDYNRVFSVEYERTINQNSMFSFEAHIFNIIDNKTGELLYIRKGVKIKVILEILTKKIYVIYHNSKYECNDLGSIAKDRRKNTVYNSKELNELLTDLNQNKNL